MKKIISKGIFVMIFGIFLVGCGNNEKEITDNESQTLEKNEKAAQTKITQTQIKYYTNESFRQFLKISEYNDGTWEQDDAINASIKRSNWVLKEIEQFENSEEKSSIKSLAISVNDISTKLKNKEYKTAEEVENDSFKVGEKIRDIADNYLDGELPPSALTLDNK